MGLSLGWVGTGYAATMNYVKSQAKPLGPQGSRVKGEGAVRQTVKGLHWR